MQKLINVLALASFAVSAAVVGGGAYLYLNKDALIEDARQKATEAVTEAITSALPGMVEGLLPEMPEVEIPELPTETGPALPF
nr:hypothetical protein [uncultured Mediterranean phage uvMED]|tara:strand:+ start:3892 stop:4140 length:249 start_codon:yes stop_codon:yes gene_type:complete